MIHPSAIISSKTKISEDVKIGPYCIVDEGVSIGSGTKLMSHVYITGNTSIGKNNIFFPFSSIGTIPQDLKYSGEDSLLTIGNNNKFREHVTINSGTKKGGMITKIWAAKICMSFGCSMVISGGLKKYPLKNIKYNNSSWFLAKKNQKSAKKLWIINQLKPAGKIQIDNGATKAIKNNKSLLPAGILKIEGNFEKGDAVEIHNKNAEKIAIGLSNYNKNDISRIMGKKSKQIKKILGYIGRDEFIHKNDLVVL